MRIDRCRWVKDADFEEGGFWVPACWEGMMCQDNCTCPKPPSRKRKNETEDWYAMIERRLSALEDARHD